MKKESFRKLISGLLHILTRTTYYGIENIPKEGAVIIATNHLSRLDIPLLFCCPARPDMTALVTDKYKDHWLFAWFVKTAEGIWIDRTKADFTAFRMAGEVFEQGKALGIAPEGTRSQVGGLIEAKSGTILLAMKHNVPIVPVGIDGSESAFKKMLYMGRPVINLRYGPMMSIEPLENESKSQTLARLTDELMARIAALLPEHLRGVYRDHPLLPQMIELTQQSVKPDAKPHKI